MLVWLNAETQRKEFLEIPPHRYYQISCEMKDYFEDITKEAQLQNIPPVLFKIFNQNEDEYTKNYYNHRRLHFEIRDEHNYHAYLKEVDV